MNRMILTGVVLLLGGSSFALLPACSRSSEQTELGHDTHDGGHDPNEQNDRAHGENELEGSGHGGHSQEAQTIWLDEHERAEFGIEIDYAGAGVLIVERVLRGEVKPNPDSLVHMTPRVPGVVRQVFKGLGETVSAGDLLAVLDSRELGEGKAEFLAARGRLELAKSKLEREKYLYEREISSEQDYLEAKQAEAEARIALNSAEQRLHALGMSEDEIVALTEHPETRFTRYEMRAPLHGTVIDKHITLGEMLREEDVAFVISDLSLVWVLLTVYQKDLASIHPGQPVIIAASHGVADSEGTIDYVSPIIDKATRTTTARVVVSNEEGHWRPGLFVTAYVLTDRVEASVVVPKTAVQTIDGGSVVFVLTDDGFEPRAVQLGRSDADSFEILSGLNPGERFVAAGGFVLKAELNKASFEHAGHAH